VARRSVRSPLLPTQLILQPPLSSLVPRSTTDTAIGVLEVKLDSARGIKSTKLGGGAPDPYVSVAIAGKQEVARTKTMPSTYNPQWNEVSLWRPPL
jgi:Ca2+-dependent lipid-binding protein